MSVEFVDSNILVYAHDESDPVKQKIAAELIARLWKEKTGALSIQVLQEFHVAITRKTPKTLPVKTALALMEPYTHWPVYSPAGVDVLEAASLAESRRINFWDAMIVIAAKKTGAAILWSEDLSHGQSIGGVEIRNPFKKRGS
jgi:predicted nucleic acid-binding protein